MSKITKDQALAISKSFRDSSNELGTYRFAHWKELSPQERQTLENEEWTLLNYSSDFITKAVGISLDGAAFSLKQLLQAVDEASTVVQKIKTAKKAIELAGALVMVGAAIVTKDPGAIATAAGRVSKVIEEINKINEQEV